MYHKCCAGYQNVAILPNVILNSVILLNAIVLNVVAPSFRCPMASHLDERKEEKARKENLSGFDTVKLFFVPNFRILALS